MNRNEVMVSVIEETDKSVVYTDGEKTYVCDKEKFYKKYEKSL